MSTKITTLYFIFQLLLTYYSPVEGSMVPFFYLILIFINPKTSGQPRVLSNFEIKVVIGQLLDL